MPGLITPSGTVFSPINLPFCDGVPLADLISEASGLPTVVANDANAAASGEHLFGAGRVFDSFLMITIGTGVGGGVILDGHLWEGADGFAGEFGHLTVFPDGPDCPCGNTGCLERYSSATAIVNRALSEGWSREGLTADSLAAEALAGNDRAAEIFTVAGRALGLAAAIVVNLLNIQAIIVGGGVSRSFPLFAPAMESEMRRRAFYPSVASVQLVRGELGDDAGVLGAAARAMKKEG
jgi:glucokinase